MSIYKIEPICEHDEGEIYIGSTTNTLNKRMITHRRDYKLYKNEKYHFITSFILFDKYGIENCNIILLEIVKCNSKDELLAREGYYIRILKCVNKRIEGRTQKEWILENKEELQEYKKEYDIKNKEEINKKSKIYYQENKEKLSEKGKIKFICECGIESRISHRTRHNRTKKHIAFMESSKVVDVSF